MAARPVSNPPNPWRRSAEGGYEVEWLGAPPEARVEVLEESARSIITRNDSPDVPFSFGVNAYRGCQHACAYCYARPGHQHLGFGAGTDFDTKIVVKTNAEELLRAELARGRTGPAGRRDWIAMSGVTDPYQPLEASFALTRRMLEACLEFRQPVGLITKSALVRRDAELLGRLARAAGARVFLSIPFASQEDARALEPWAPSPRLRFDALAALRDQGVPTGVSLSPMIPGLNDHAIPEILQRAAEAGATRAFMILLRLPAEVAPVFEERLRAAFPDRADRVLGQLEQCRQDQSSRAAFGSRMAGSGPRWQAVEDVFTLWCRRLGLEVGEGERVEPLSPGPPAPPSPIQPELFGD